MTAAASLPRPGVQVIQQFRATTPTIITPTLVPTVVGVCKQIVDVLVSNGSGGQILNSQALIDLPAFFYSVATGTPPMYTGLDGEELVMSINNAPNITIAFSDPSGSGLTPSTIVDQITMALTQQGVTSAKAVLLDEATWEFATLGVGDFQEIYIDPTTSAEVAAAFGVGVGKTYYGISNYSQYSLTVPEVAFPNPRNNLEELEIETSTVEVFLSTGNAAGILEVSKTATFLSNGAVNEAAILETTTDLTTLAYQPTPALSGKTLVFVVDQGVAQTVTFPGTLTDPADVITAIQAVLSGATPTLVGGKYLEVTDNTLGVSGSLSVSGTAITSGTLSFPATSSMGTNIAAIDDGNGDAYTPLLQFAGYNFTTPAGEAVLTAAGVPTLGAGLANHTLVISDGGTPQTIVFTGAESAITGATNSVQATIEAVMGEVAGGHLVVSETIAPNKIVFTNTKLGNDSMIKIIGGTALALLDTGVTPTLIAGAEVHGAPYPPMPGDQIWIDGSLYAHVTKVAPGGVTSVLRIDTQVPVNPNVGTYFYFEAQNLVYPPLPNRPVPDLIVDANNNAILKAEILRDWAGNPVSSVAPIYVSYEAVRLDVTAVATDPGILTFEDTTTVENTIGPTTADNPLALAFFFGLINAPGIQMTGLGVDAVSDREPFGTLDAYIRAAEYLEGFEVYAIAPLTHEENVAQVFNTHVQFMSEPVNRGERIVLWNPAMPKNALDTLVASGTNGDALGTAIFDTKITNLSSLLQNAGVSPVGVIPVTAGVFVQFATSALLYSVKSIYGSQITVRTTAADFPSGTNDDDFYAETVLPVPLLQSTFSISVRGKPLVTTIGTVDKNAVANTINGLGQSFANRRFWMTFPDRCTATINGVSQIIDGFYMNAATVGAIGQQPPQQSFTNFPITGFVSVEGSNDTFSESQLDVMAGGGAYIFVQDGPSTPIYARMALTTDLTSIETRTDSVTKVVDFTAKFMRSSLKNFIGRFNITQGFLDSLGTTIQGLFGFLTETGVLIGGTLDNVVQDENNRDTVLIDTTLDVPIPCNYIKLTLVI